MKHPRLYAPFFLFLIFLISGCGPKRPETDPGQDQKAGQTAFALLSRNQEIKTSKGVAWVRLDTDSRKDKFRLAWIVQAPDRARLTLLSSGILYETIIADGTAVRFISHTNEHKPYTTHVSDPDMEKLIHIPIKLSEIILILSGRLPVTEFDDAWFSSDPPDQTRISLKKKDSTSLYQLELDSSGILRHLTAQKRNQAFLYGIEYRSWEKIQGYNVPTALTIKDRIERTLHLEMSTFQINVSIKEGVFWLTEPGS